MDQPIVLVTGCSEGGLGYHLCEEFLAKGYKVYAGVRRTDSAKGLTALGAVLLELDVTKAESREQAIKDVINNEGRLDVLVNNAGIAGYRAALIDIPLSDMQAVYDANFFAPIALTQLVVPHMARQKKKGRIINICSISGYAATPFVSIYGSSKGALTYVSDCLRRELQPLGIHVMHVALGAVKTSMQGKARDSLLTWPADSLYYHAQHHVHETYRKAHLKGTEPQVCAKTIVGAALKPGAPPRCLWTGSQWWVFWLVRFVPGWLLDWVCRLMFKLGKFVEVPQAPMQGS